MKVWVVVTRIGLTLALLWALGGFLALAMGIAWLGTHLFGTWGFLMLPIGIFVAGAWYIAGAMLEDFRSRHDRND